MSGLRRGDGPPAIGPQPLDPAALQQMGLGCMAAAAIGLLPVAWLTVVEARRRVAAGKDLGFPVPWIVEALPLFMVLVGVMFLWASSWGP